MDRDELQRLSRTLAVGGIAVVTTDAGPAVCCDPQAKEAVRRAYAALRRRVSVPAPVLFGTAELAAAALPALPPRTAAALHALAGRPVTSLVDNPTHRFALACGEEPSRLLVRVAGAPLDALTWPMLALEIDGAIPPLARDSADLVLDAAQAERATIVDLRGFDADSAWQVLREGAVTATEVEARLPA